jgi:predicted nucleic acid-binding protein
VVYADPTDIKIIECAVAACSAYLVTGDKHLLVSASYRGTKILEPAEFLRLLREH